MVNKTVGNHRAESSFGQEGSETVQVAFPGPLLRARFLERPNRFTVRVRLADGNEVHAHLPDPGRLQEILLPDAPLWLVEASTATARKTHYGVLLAETPAGLISLDTRIPTQLVRRALEKQAIPTFSSYDTVRPEVAFGRSRIDFLLSGANLPPLLLEVKSVTLVVDGVGLFPDAVTSRGARHMAELAQALDHGYRAAVLFVIQREDALAVGPHEINDPLFGRALRQAARAGVQLVGYTCHLTLEGITLARPVPVRL